MKSLIARFGALHLALVGMAVALTPTLAHAQEAAEGAGRAHAGMLAVAIAIGIGLAALGGTLAQSRAAAAALEGITRNPNSSDKVFVPLLLSLSLIESLVLVTWVLMFMLQNKI